MMMVSQVVVLFILLFVVVTIAKGVRIVPQGEEWIVERLGKYRTTLTPGLHILIPYIDAVKYTVTTKDLILDIEQQEVITKDNAVIIANAVAFVKVTDPVGSVYGVTDFRLAVRNLVKTTLRSIIGNMDLDESLSSREQIKTKLKASIADQAIDWGVTIKSVEIQDIKPSASMQMAMEQQASAERERKAMVTRAEGEKQSVILGAQGKLEAAKLEAEAQIRLAESSAQAMRQVTEAIADKQLSAMYLLGEKYLHSLQAIGASGNSKYILLPADMQEALRGLLGKPRP
jgi:regulator of protease activity HflC (stomatin/prohibitin superfamily)